MKLSGLHFLLTYQCTFECDHCFVWGSPWQSGTMTLEMIRKALRQAQEIGTVRSIYFEGGEPMLYYPVLLEAVRLAVGMGFETGIVSNAYWATSLEDAREWLRPFVGLIQDLSVSTDLYHYDESVSQQARHAMQAAQELGIPLGVLSIAPPETAETDSPAVGQIPLGESGVMFRGRAVEKLAPQAKKLPWNEFNGCPYEDLREPGRVHLDPLGYLHVCQGISIGNLFEVSLKEISDRYVPEEHPVIGPLLVGGPAELARKYEISPPGGYADACHLCYQVRVALRQRFPEELTPDQMYGVFEN